jgi:uncharacterized protein (TIGR00730 family)
MTEPLVPPLDRAPLAYENPDFLNSPDGRLVRIIAEYSEPMARFQQQRIQDTVVFFGSARFGAPGHDGPMSACYEDARTLAALLTTWAMALPGHHHRFVVTSGGGPGIMEAANRGAHEAGGKTIGLNIKLPHEQRPNPYITPELNFEFRYFFMRKFWFAYLAKALVVFPGGFGTLDELFEIVTLAQTQKLAKNIPIIIYGSAYWKSVLNIDALIEQGAVSAVDRGLLQFADTPEEAFGLLQAALANEIAVTGFPHNALADLVEPAPSSQELLGPDIAKTRS